MVLNHSTLQTLKEYILDIYKEWRAVTFLTDETADNQKITFLFCSITFGVLPLKINSYIQQVLVSPKIK